MMMVIVMMMLVIVVMMMITIILYLHRPLASHDLEKGEHLQSKEDRKKLDVS
jgi:fatty-acid desaturase